MTDEPFKILETTIEVANRGESFVFRIPNSKDEGRFAANLKKLRREIDPDGVGPGEEYGWDQDADMHMKSAAWMMTSLVSTSADWVFSPGADGKPTIDWGKWPARNANRVVEIVISFLSGVARFRKSIDEAGIAGPFDRQEAVDGGTPAGA